MRNFTLTQTKINHLNKLALPKVSTPFSASVLWLRVMTGAERTKKQNTDEHSHSFFEVHYVLSGSINYEFDGRCHEVGAGEAVVFAPGVLHRRRSASSDSVRLGITFKPDEGEHAFDKIRDRRAFVFTPDACAKNDLEGIFLEIDRRSTHLPILVCNRVVGVLIELTESCGAREDGARDVRVERAKRYVEDNKRLFLTCAEVAEYCHFNVKHLNRIFKAETGQTLLRYIHDVKREEAERLLKETDLTLVKVSEALGFRDEYYFNAFFRREVGVSPGEYRKLSKKN